MTYTSAEASKLLRKLSDEYNALLDKEERSREFHAAMGEAVEYVRPEYDYEKTQNELNKLEYQIRKLKHAIHQFNITHRVPDFDLTIDEMLIYIPQLTQKKNNLAEMKSKLPKARVEERLGRQSNIIDYIHINYDLGAVEADYNRVSDELSKAQIALDIVNTTDTFEFNF